MIFQPNLPVLKRSFLTGPPSSLIASSHPPPPFPEPPRHGHELSSVLGRSQNLRLFHLQDTLGHYPFDALEGETGLILHLGAHYKPIHIFCDDLRHSMVNTAGHISLRECEISPGRPLNLDIGNSHDCRVNVVEGKPCDRQMTTGNHTVRDIYCIKCGVTLGWKYVSISDPVCMQLTGTLADEVISFQDRAYDPSQKYKEGKYILERNLLVDVQ